MSPAIIKKLKIRYIIGLGVLLIIFLSSAFHFLLWLAANKLETSTVDLVKKQNLAMAISGSKTLENFFQKKDCFHLTIP